MKTGIALPLQAARLSTLKPANDRHRFATDLVDYGAA